MQARAGLRRECACRGRGRATRWGIRRRVQTGSALAGSRRPSRPRCCPSQNPSLSESGWPSCSPLSGERASVGGVSFVQSAVARLPPCSTLSLPPRPPRPPADSVSLLLDSHWHSLPTRARTEKRRHLDGEHGANSHQHGTTASDRLSGGQLVVQDNAQGSVGQDGLTNERRSSPHLACASR